MGNATGESPPHRHGRELGLSLPGVPGPWNAISDMPGVAAGYTTLIEDPPGGKPVRTGAMAILSRKREDLLNPIWAGTFSIIAIVGTDAPLLPIQLRRVAQRIAIGMGRGGTPSGNNSGDIYLAFSTANNQGPFPEPERLRFEALSNDDLDALFLATVEAVDEAILNALLGAETMQGKHGRIVHAIDPECLRSIILKSAESADRRSAATTNS